MISEELRSRTMEFTRTMENPEGGFNYPRDSPASIEETYFALSLLRRLGATYSNSRTNAFVRGVPINENTILKHLYQMASICDILGLEDKDKEIGEAFLAADRPVRQTSDLHYHVLLWRRYGGKDLDRRAVARHIERTLSRRPLPLSSCCRCILVGELLGLHIPSDRLIDWIRASQNRDGGFGFYPGTTSFLENVWYALQGLASLRSRPLDVEGCEEFVLSCATGTGGFSRQMGAMPTLEYSFMAIESLAILDDMRGDQPRHGGDLP